MIRNLLFLIICVYSSALFADAGTSAQWSRLGIRFEADQALFNSNKVALQRNSGEIADLISTVMSEIPQEISSKLREENLLVIYEKSASTDAVFYPAGTKRNTSDIIITVNPALIDSPNLERLISHELFHAVHYEHNKNELDWVREGMAQLFETKLYGGFNQAHVIESLTKSNFPLESDFDIQNYQKEKYGNTFLFFYYLSSHCDPQRDLIWRMVLHGKSGRAGINAVLAKSSCGDFLNAAEMFSIARLVNSYSGPQQSPDYFIISVMQKMTVDPLRENSLRLKDLGLLQPVKVSIRKARELVPTAPSDASFWGLEKKFPNRVRRLSPQEISTLSESWDIGIVRVK